MTEERGHLTRQQVERGLRPVRPDRIEVLRGLSYVPAEEVRAELIRQFGVGNWDSQVIVCDLLYEKETTNKKGDLNWNVCYRVGVQLRVRDYNGNPIAEFVEYHIGQTQHPDLGEAHANAVTSASSYALRRCAIGLGDNYGLHLYHKGSTAPLINGTLQLTEHLNPAATAAAETGANPDTGELPPEPTAEAAAAAKGLVAQAFN